MKPTILVAALCACVLTNAQTNYEPQILVLAPHSVTYGKEFEAEIDSLNAEIKNNVAQWSARSEDEADSKRPPNLAKMKRDVLDYVKTTDYTNSISMQAQQYLIYRFIEHFPNLLISVQDITCNGELTEYKRILSDKQFQYVLNFRSIQFYTESGESKARVLAQMYDQVTQSIVMNEEVIGDWDNRGFEWSCPDSTLDCTVSNALSQILPEVIKVVALANPTLKRKRELAKNRFDVLMRDHFSRSFDSAVIKHAVPASDSSVDFKSMYQLLVAPSKDKFVGFFYSYAGVQDFAKYKDGIGSDKVISINTSKALSDSTILDATPQVYSYIVKGVKYENAWYYEKTDATLSEPDNFEDGRKEHFNGLQKWGFFKEESVDVDPQFWETHLFDKVVDRTKDPMWEKYKESIWETEERENREYIGMYRIVANELKSKQRAENEAQDSIIGNSVFRPFLDAQVHKKKTSFASYALLYDKPTVIYPKKRNVYLNPVAVTDGKNVKWLRYYLAFKGESKIYEWTYFKPMELTGKSWHYGSDIIDQLAAITKWNFSFETLDDKNFWEKYVLAKEKGKYKYLRVVE